MDTFSEITSYIKKDVNTGDVGDAMKHLLEVRHTLVYAWPYRHLNEPILSVAYTSGDYNRVGRS